MAATISAWETTASRPPPAVGVQRHELDEAQLTPGRAAVGGQDTTSSSLTPRSTTTLTFTGEKPASLRGVDAVEHPHQLVAPGHAGEALRSQRVQR
jgi:hypothetical protein